MRFFNRSAGMYTGAGKSGTVCKSTQKAGRKSSGAGNRGTAVAEVIIAAAMLVFIILPVFSAVMEKYVLSEKARIIKDSVDMANISAYNALDTAELGKTGVDVTRSKAMDIYEEVLKANLNLDENLDPLPGSVAEGRVKVVSLEIYRSGFPGSCPNGTSILRPSVHSSISIPVRPSLYRTAVLSLLGRDHIDIVVHVDSEIPVNN